MRRARAFGVLVAVLLVSGCAIGADNKSSGCTSDPGITTDGSSVCTKPAPTEFNQMGQ